MKWKTITVVIFILMGVVFIFHLLGVGGGRIINAELGDNFTIELESNPTTGYKWYADYNKEKLGLVKTDFVSSHPKRVGSSGTRSFIFNSKEKGVSKIDFIYKRSFGESREIQKRVYKIFVR